MPLVLPLASYGLVRVLPHSLLSDENWFKTQPVEPITPTWVDMFPQNLQLSKIEYNFSTDANETFFLDL